MSGRRRRRGRGTVDVENKARSEFRGSWRHGGQPGHFFVLFLDVGHLIVDGEELGQEHFVHVALFDPVVEVLEVGAAGGPYFADDFGGVELAGRGGVEHFLQQLDFGFHGVELVADADGALAFGFPRRRGGHAVEAGLVGGDGARRGRGGHVALAVLVDVDAALAAGRAASGAGACGDAVGGRRDRRDGGARAAGAGRRCGLHVVVLGWVEADAGMFEGLVGHEEVGEASGALETQAPGLNEICQLVAQLVFGLFVLDDADQRGQILFRMDMGNDVPGVLHQRF